MPPTRTTRLGLALSLACALLGGGPALAQRDDPGDFTYYVLVLSWSPTFCAETGHSPCSTKA